jgi:predicted outer membrane repeat protein
VFRENQALLGEGGAIYNVGTLVLQDNTLFEINNSRDGGAVYNGGDVGIPAVIQDVSFERNSARNNGGAICNGSAETGLTISGTAFTSNYALNGGAIYTEGGDLNISASTFDENRAGRTTDPTTGDGGAIYSLAGDVWLFETSFNLQTAIGVGGIIYAGPGSEVTLTRVWSEENKACHGGGALYVEGETEVIQTTLKSNHIGGWVGWGFDISYFEECWYLHGGAIYNTGTLLLDRSLLDNNWAAEGDGDGIFNTGDLTVVNSTIHAECCYEGEAVNNHGNAELSLSTIVNSSLVNSGSMTVKNIVVADTISGGCINSGTFVDMHENIALDPACPFSTILNWSELIMDSSLSDNGGPTLTHHVDVTSPLINNATCDTVAGVYPPVDQRGLLRPDRTYCDIGAFEVHDFSDPVGPGQPTAQPFSPEQQPPQPMPPPGCLNRPPTGGDPICVVPCPDGADPGTPCNP